MTDSSETRDERLVTLFERALELPLADRAAFLDAACGEDSAMREELASLLHANESASGYFDALAADIISPAHEAISRSRASAADRDFLPRLQAALADSYRIERELGGGAMSRVFLAEEIKLGRKVVIKVLPPEMAASVSAERFRREIQVAAQLQHAHIVPLLTSGSADSLLYYTMPFVAGESLAARLAREGAVPVGDAQRIWRDVLDALAHAHANGVVHRDIKPANILLGGRNALVADFGIARAIEAAASDSLLTATGLAIGTPNYMAPEQVTGSADADHRVDIYASALVTYEMLEGRPPFSGSSLREVVLARIGSAPPPLRNPDCPPALSDLVLRCLATDPDARPQSADEVLAALDAVGPASHPAVVGRRRSDYQRLLYVAAFTIGVAAVFGIAQMRDRANNVSASEAAAQRSVAVLPLTNLSTDPADAPLAAGMTEELIAALSAAGKLRVLASTSVQALTDQRMSVRQIAESLRVSHVLEGAFQKIGGRMRMQVRLVDPRDGSTRWSETYDREMNDILAVQHDIAVTVARELDVRLTGSNVTRSRPAPNIEAYEWYLRGMDVALLRSDSGRRRGLEYFNRAIAIDSNFAAAYAGLVRMYLTPRGDQMGNVALAERAARKAVALDDSLAEARAALGWAFLGGQRFREAEAELRRAIALDRNVPRGHEGLARAYMHMGRPAEQLAAARAGVENDPFSHSAIRELALALSVNGRCDEAIERLRPLKRLTPPAYVAAIIIGMCHCQREAWPAAIAEFRWALNNTGAALALYGYSLARSGRGDEARKILADLLAGRRSSNGAYGIAVVYAGLRDYDQAFAWLNKSYDDKSLRAYIFDPMFSDLHRDPRFARLKARMRA